MDQPIILIGPVKAGKTTIGKLLAERLGRPFMSLDRLERTYTETLGFDPELAALIQTQHGDWARYTYRRQYFAEALMQFLVEYTRGVLELGGGHPILPDPEEQQKVERTLQPFRHVVLLLPSPDLRESLTILKGRQKPEHLNPDLNEELLADDRFLRLAKHVLYTQGKSPNESCEELLAKLGVSPL